MAKRHVQPLLNDVRVLDLTQLLPGPYATTLLADLGAEVIKVEKPDGGDPIRDREPTVAGQSYAHLLRNRNKRSIVLDLKHERGKRIFHEMAASADVVIESFRPGVVEDLGIDYASIRPYNDDIIYCSMSGYGQSGPYAGRPGHDLNYIGVAGLLEVTGTEQGPPVPIGYPVGDFFGAMYAAFAIVAAYTGVLSGSGGDYIDISITDTIASMAVVYADTYFGGRETPSRGQTRLTGRHPGYGVYETADREYLTIAAMERVFWDNLCGALDRPDLAEHYVKPDEVPPREVADEVTETIGDIISDRSREEWLERFEAADVPAAPVYDFDEMFRDPHIRSRGLLEELEIATDDDGALDSTSVKQFNSPIKFRNWRTAEKSPAPTLGGDTEILLQELGYTAAEIDELSDIGVVAIPD